MWWDQCVGEKYSVHRRQVNQSRVGVREVQS